MYVQKKISILPSKPKYNKLIEDNIKILENELKKEYKLNKNLYRWISLKLIDGEKTILNSIGNHLNIDITTNENINIKLNNVLGNLEQENINKSNFKNVIISSIVTTMQKKLVKKFARFTR